MQPASPLLLSLMIYTRTPNKADNSELAVNPVSAGQQRRKADGGRLSVEPHASLLAFLGSMVDTCPLLFTL